MSISQARPINKSNTPNDQFGWLLVTSTAGSVIFNVLGGNQVTLPSVPTGVWIPVGNATNIMTASTAVGFLVA